MTIFKKEDLHKSIKFEQIINKEKLIYKGLLIGKDIPFYTNKGVYLFVGISNIDNSPKLYKFNDNMTISKPKRTRLDKNISIECHKILEHILKSSKEKYKRNKEDYLLLQYIKEKSIIENTGYDWSLNKKSSSTFKTAIMDKNVFNEVKIKFNNKDIMYYISTFCTEYNIDFFCLSNTETVDVFHITETKNLDFIETNGLIYDDNVSGDLGSGIYTFVDSEKGLANIEKFFKDFSDYFEKDYSLLVIEYTGESRHCIFGENHEDYIVLKNSDNISIEDIKEDIDFEELEDYLYD